MHVLAINGSPRKTWNTATLLENALAGAAAQGATTELTHLYDLDYKGCRSCFACKLVDGPSYGRCVVKDPLTPLLRQIEEQTDVLLLGTPIYFGAMTGEMRSFLERLLFAPLIYSQPPRSLFPRRIKVAVLYTMNVTKEISRQVGYEVLFNSAEASLSRALGPTETFCAYDTCQFPDYSKVVMECMDPVKKALQKTKAFPAECQKAFALGERLVSSP